MLRYEIRVLGSGIRGWGWPQRQRTQFKLFNQAADSNSEWASFYIDVTEILMQVRPACTSLSAGAYRDASLIRNRRLLGPYKRTMPRALRGSYGGGRFLVSEVTL